MVLSALVIASTLKSAVGLMGTSLWLVPLVIIGLSYYRYDQLDPESRVIDKRPLNQEYDFIVIGGGSAGAVVASRLSEIPDWNILLLEAGPDENEITDVPSLAAYLQLTKLDWKYKTEPTGTSCLAMKKGRCNWPRGKVLGGSSTLNYMLYVRGNRYDYDHWEALGNPGWGYDQALYYFKKSEDNRNPYLKNSPYHGTGGYLTVQESPWRTPLVVAFVEAGMELGYENRDINGEYQTGFMIAQGTIRRGSRCSTAKAFLRPVRLRRNLHIGMNAHVTKIIIDPIKMKAVGVEFYRDGRKQIIRAKKEIILSAGAINSPQLLMLSGIGPKQHLESHGITVIKDLPVGNNLQDHVGMAGLTFLVDKPVAIVQDRLQPTPVTTEYVLNGRGPMTTLGGVEGYAFVNTIYANESGLYPDIQLHMAPASLSSDAGVQVRKVLSITDQVYDTVYRPITNRDAWTIMPLLLRPKSRGTIRLKNSNPFASPVINANYFDHPEDIARLVEGAKIAVRLNEAKVFQQFGSRLHRAKIPGCKNLTFGSDAYWECHIRHITMTIYHPVGTAKMGPSTDPEAVVDPRLRVYGVQSLRVIDASIMPTICSGNTNAPVIMIAEKGSDLIKNDWLDNIQR
ncbi:glucose dehydrogenase [FAD, quinone] [Chelonus insularis]|uniref:glucose dehydrogenase [FAD, quinone] n=1 Tax=Chelonus insularis TaxID=460826 RepID=UPI00158A5951|nr:glucose dehydrogenase [FAD, quinone] [Chelonus insularis]XP_034936852.1 glucose dehydrogenase [FAD, quinone] [Chelonus insularis]XP_034936853.1 glucose dehydrogenase [FAD, quinone] [Chelonus insularis]XP_034936855.1 glucose dehydrogenase [FAD, quinone] [Chelonus insularis]